MAILWASSAAGRNSACAENVAERRGGGNRISGRMVRNDAENQEAMA